MIMILIGAPGSGKGTQSKNLSSKYGFSHLATGDIFRAEIAAKTDLGRKVSEYVKSGKLVPDEIVSKMVASRMESSSGKYLLDGFPRTLEQARSLDEILKSKGRGVDVVVFLNLPMSEVLRRLCSRRVCPGCGDLYNLLTRLPKTEGICDVCGQKLIQRDDDSEQTVKKRLMVYEDLTHPLLSYYKAEGNFHEIDAARPSEVVAGEICRLVDQTAVKP
jgi:adenylate kinase